MSGSWATHGVETDGELVVKRFRQSGDGRPQREWRALNLIEEYAPGIAPSPVSAELSGPRPTVVMTRLPGEPLRGTPVTPDRVRAMAGTLSTLFTAVPAPVVARLPERRSRQQAVVEQVRAWHDGPPGPSSSPVVARAVEAGMDWLTRSGPGSAALRADVPAVLGPGDGNLANYLWDGSRIRMVDFEDSGRSDRAYELAEITEHVSAWSDTTFDVTAFIGHFDLTDAEARRLPECRRLLALVWLFLLSFDDPRHPRNPAGTADRQAERLLERLG